MTTSEVLRREPHDSSESRDEKSQRLAHERALLEQAREVVQAGFFIPDERVEDWLDRMVDSDEPLPIPGVESRGSLAGATPGDGLAAF